MSAPLVDRLRIGANELRERAYRAPTLADLVLDVATILEECRDAILERDATIAELRRRR